MERIQSQVTLPMAVARQVVMQGIRIRFGRSMVTLTGVVLGIAFLMSIFTRQVITRGVGQEIALRKEIARMMSFLVAETGPIEGKVIGAIQIGPLNDAEKRFISAVAGSGVAELNWAAVEGISASAPPGIDALKNVSLKDVGTEASAVLLLGSGTVPAVDWRAVLQHARQRVIGLTRATVELTAADNWTVALLDRELRDEEKTRIAAEARIETNRNTWITIIAILVTVMGITNAMLMSVTERFKEIGTMKCLGALSSFIRQIFLIESTLIGAVGSLIGCAVGMIFSLIVYSVTFGPGMVLGSLDGVALALYFGISFVIGIILSIIAAIYPASFASRMVPAMALRTNV